MFPNHVPPPFRRLEAPLRRPTRVGLGRRICVRILLYLSMLKTTYALEAYTEVLALRQLPVPEDPLGARNYFSADRVGPEAPRGSRLGPDGENRVAASIFGSTSTPTKQFCISSQFWSPQ